MMFIVFQSGQITGQMFTVVTEAQQKCLKVYYMNVHFTKTNDHLLKCSTSSMCLFCIYYYAVKIIKGCHFRKVYNVKNFKN